MEELQKDLTVHNEELKMHEEVIEKAKVSVDTLVERNRAKEAELNENETKKQRLADEVEELKKRIKTMQREQTQKKVGSAWSIGE